VTGFDEGLEYQCPECGMYFFASLRKCPRCRREFIFDEGTLKEKIENIASPIKSPKMRTGVDKRVPTVETIKSPEDAPRSKHKTSGRVRKRVVHKKVRKRASYSED